MNNILKGGMSRDEMERAAVLDGSRRSPNMPPRDASTLIIMEGEGPGAKILMGRRHEGHKFMPGLFVFPGGRVDRYDGSVPAASELHPVIEQKSSTPCGRGRPAVAPGRWRSPPFAKPTRKPASCSGNTAAAFGRAIRTGRPSASLA